MKKKTRRDWQRALKIAFATAIVLMVLVTYTYIVARHFFEAGMFAIQSRPRAQQTGVTWTQPLVETARPYLSPTTPIHDYVLILAR